MSLLISAVFAYIFLGISQVKKVLSLSVKINFLKIWSAFIFWFSEIIDAHMMSSMMGLGTSQLGRTRAFMLADIISKMFAMTLIIWLQMFLVGLLVNNLFIKALIVFIVTYVSMPLLGILHHILSNVLGFVIAIPASILFPLKK